MAKMIDYIQKMISDEVTVSNGLGQLLGSRITDIKEGQATIEYEATKNHASPTGALHGGILCFLGDSAASMAYASVLEQDETCASLELKINYLKPVWEGKLQAIGRLVHKGRTIGLAEFDIINEKNNLVARGSATMMTLKGDQARGRLMAK